MIQKFTSRITEPFKEITKEDVLKYTIFLSFFVIAGVIIFQFYPNTSKFQYAYEKNTPWKYDEVTAQFAFEIQKSEEELQEEEVSLLKDFEPLFDVKEEVKERNLSNLKEKMGKESDEASLPYYRYISKKLSNIYDTGIISGEDFSTQVDEGHEIIRVTIENVSKEALLANFNTTKTTYEKIINDAPQELNRDILRNYNLTNYIECNVIFNEEKTNKLKEDLLRTISLTKGQVQIGEKIIDHGEVIGDKEFDILNSYKQELEKRSQNANNNMIALGQGIIIATSLLVFFLYFCLFRQKFLVQKKDTVFRLSMIVLFCIITSLAVDHNFSPYLIPYALIPIVITTFFDTRTALFTHLTTVLLCSFIVNDEFEFLFLQVIIGMISICTLKNISQRSDLVRSALLTFVSYVTLYFGFALVHERGMGDIDLRPIEYFLINGILLLFANPFIYIVEKLFGYTSSTTLAELGNTNNSLLRKLGQQAPNTLQHSIQVSVLAEEVARAIGAKVELVKTAALYHDIGKMTNPEFFTENQHGINPHDQLPEFQSAEIIIRHVSEGLRIADEYGLPESIKDFIRTHHGMSKTRAFLTKYKNNHPGEAVDESKFAYPGPKPTSKEMAILSICDSVEAASRSLGTYTDDTINDLVEKIINGQLQDGMFDEADIKMRDFAVIKRLLKDKLKIIYHTRISYPELKQ